MAAATTSTRATSSFTSPLSSQTSNTKGRFISSGFSDLICNSTSDLNLSENKAKKTGPNIECCMCGDVGVSSELYRCKICRFRSQHRYCSNLYPKADSYRVCNWCLIQKNDNTNTTPSTQRLTSNSPNLSSPYKQKHNIKHNEKPDPHHHHHPIVDNNNKMMKKMKINSPPSTPVADQNNNLSPGAMQRRKPQIQLIGSPTSKKRKSSPESIPSPSPRKRIVANNSNDGGGGEKLIRRTKSEEITNRNKTCVTTKHVFRNKVVRRYKHLDEVSC